MNLKKKNSKINGKDKNLKKWIPLRAEILSLVLWEHPCSDLQTLVCSRASHSTPRTGG